MSPRSQTQPLRPVPSTVHRPLAGDAYVSLMPPACLALRAGAPACRACAQACPVHALEVNADGPRLRADCLHCGRCAAACPSGALRAQGFADALPATGPAGVELECRRAPQAAQALHVPCLGGLSVTRLLSWWLAAGDRPLGLVDRGACASCPAGGDGFAARESLLQANRWLADCGLAPQRWIRLRLDTSAALAPYRREPIAAPALSRRDFLRRVSTDIATHEAAASPPPGPRALVRLEPAPLPERERLLQLLQAIADRHGRDLPARAWPSITVNAHCTDDGVCVGVCPTGALQRREHDDATALTFDAARCVSCRRCEDVCAPHALQLGIGGSAGLSIVHRRPTRECLHCGAPVIAAPGAALCPRCNAGQGLARAVFGMRVADSPLQTNRHHCVHEEPSNERPDSR